MPSILRLPNFYWSEKVRVKIGRRLVGDGQPCFIIAEIGVNHNGSVDQAIRLIAAAKRCGADAVKFQIFKAAALVTAAAPKAAYQKKNDGAHESQQAMLQRLELTDHDFARIKQSCDQQGILFLASPFDDESLRLLIKLGAPAVKLGSGEVTSQPFLEKVGQTRRPVLLSTGMSSLAEVRQAVRVLKTSGCPAVIVLHCVTNYPAVPADVNLRAMQTLRRACRALAGFSDHTIGPIAAQTAAALGACVIEKHFTLDKNAAGPDHRASSDPAELTALVQGVRTVECLLGDGKKMPTASESAVRSLVRKSITTCLPIKKGEKFSANNLTIKRPGTGIPPAEWKTIVGKRAACTIAADTTLVSRMVAGYRKKTL
jgi:N-acetylneuraminate synthase